MLELTGAIRRTRVTTPGEDNISANLFKGLNEHSLDLLLMVYNSLWSSGTVPESWKSAIIVPIIKPGRPKRDVSSYRPIALTSVMGKICERMIANRLRDYIMKNKLLDYRHLGFLPFRDCQTAILMLNEDIKQGKRDKKYILGVALDLEAAYDSVFIDGLMLKCASIGITGPILLWLYRFLKGRSIKVTWRNMVSLARAMGKGVPQGAVLSPILFTIFMADFFEVLEGYDIKWLVYADDIFVYCLHEELKTCFERLQGALRDISQWCMYWKLCIRPDKCQAINLSRRRGDCEFQLCINNGLIKWSKEIKFLGVYMARYGGLRCHSEYLRKKAFSRINILKALAQKKYGARSHHLCTLAFSTICSVVDYGAVLLGSACTSILKRLEVLQNSAFRVALGLPKWVPIIVLRRYAGVPTLADRISDLSFRFWIKHAALDSWSPLWSWCNGELDTSAVRDPGMQQALDEMGCTLAGMLRFQFPLPTRSDVVTLHLTDFPFQSTGVEASMVVPYFFDFLHSLTGHYDVIATDASKSDSMTAIAGCTNGSQFGYRIHHINSIFTAEALAIGTALDELVTLGQSFLLLTDSLSVLRALLNVNCRSPRSILWLHNKLQRIAQHTIEIRICWVPGHRGIPLNEKADRIAKEITETDVFVDWISPEDIIRKNKQRVLGLSDRQFRHSSYQASHGDIPSIKNSHMWTTNRRDDVLVARLVCRMLITPAVLFRFGLTRSDQCTSCQVTDSLDHIILSCIRYQALRRSCWDDAVFSSGCLASFLACMERFFGSGVFRLSMLRFLRGTGRF